MKNKSIVCLALTVQWILMLFKVEVRYSSLVGQILVLNCRHQGLVLLLKFTFTREDLSVNSEDQYFPIEGSIAIHVNNLKIVLTIAGHLMEKVVELSMNTLYNISSYTNHISYCIQVNYSSLY